MMVFRRPPMVHESPLPGRATRAAGGSTPGPRTADGSDGPSQAALGVAVVIFALCGLVIGAVVWCRPAPEAGGSDAMAQAPVATPPGRIPEPLAPGAWVWDWQLEELRPPGR